MTYHIEVYGHLWSGPRAVYSYTVPAPVDDDAAAKRAAGDFADLIDWRLVEHSCAYEQTKSPPILRQIDTYKTLRGFRNGMSPGRFYRLANA